METSERAIAYHLTKADWLVLTKENEGKVEGDDDASLDGSKSSSETKYYDDFFDNSQFRWNSIIERSVSLSHFVIVTVLGAEVREELFSKWIKISDQLRTSMGNFFSFCSVMRGLNSSSLAKLDGPLDWMKLRRDYTSATFLFETTLRSTYKGFLQGKCIKFTI